MGLFLNAQPTLYSCAKSLNVQQKEREGRGDSEEKEEVEDRHERRRAEKKRMKAAGREGEKKESRRK